MAPSPVDPRSLISPIEVLETALENEIEASRWAIASMSEHVRRLEQDLETSESARLVAEGRAVFLEQKLFIRVSAANKTQ